MAYEWGFLVVCFQLNVRIFSAKWSYNFKIYGSYNFSRKIVNFQKNDRIMYMIRILYMIQIAIDTGMVMDTLYLMSSLIHIIWIVLYGLLWSQSLWPSKVYIDFIRFSSAGIHAPKPVGTRTTPHQDQENFKTLGPYCTKTKKWNYRTAPSRTRNKYSWEIKDRYDGQMMNSMNLIIL